MIVITGLTTMQWHSCTGANDEVAQGRRFQRSGKINILKFKKFYFLHSKNFKLFTQIKGNAVSDCGVFKVHIF
jgi:hypothetical protein